MTSLAARKLLQEKKSGTAARIDHPLARYTAAGALQCKVYARAIALSSINTHNFYLNPVTAARIFWFLLFFLFFLPLAQVCNVPVKSEALWATHLASKKHRDQVEVVREAKLKVGGWVFGLK